MFYKTIEEIVKKLPNIETSDEEYKNENDVKREDDQKANKLQCSIEYVDV